MRPRSGTSPEGLHIPSLDACLSAIDRAQGKVLFTDRNGEHAERLLPDRNAGAHIPATKCYIDLDRQDPTLQSLLLPKALNNLHVLRVNAYISPAGTGADLHFDSHHVVIVQLLGMKRWEFSNGPAVERPFRNCVAPLVGAEVSYGGRTLAVPTEFTAKALRPGDWLLLPAGTWHRTHAQEYSASVTIAFE